jgi:colicin import membrane protein
MILSFTGSEMEQWRAGILIAVALHLTVLILALFGPDLINFHRKKEEIYTVKLFGPVKQPVKQAAAPAPRPAPAPSPPVPKSRPKPAPPRKEIAKTPASPKKIPKAAAKPATQKALPVKKAKPAPAAKKAVSLNPEKKKPEKKTVPKHKEKPKAPSREEILQKRIAAIEEQVRQKKEEKRLQERLDALSKKVKQKNVIRPAAQASSASASGSGTAETINEVIARYGMEVSQRVWRRWNLPTQIIDPKGLEAIIEIRIADDGRILARKFEKTSGNMLFDQSVMRAVKDANPVPPLPKQLRPGPLVMGIRFRPEDL